ncbi:hypothetical protein WICANDRAFT_79771 [Wickerhamomyces anomalus NRRL Y-366-8]|uniref:Uncharacterized protein n=1 Tax=Wickerhamomyces anomalus (strain ATCC 58044 / CBS 1984 / NCYC 433 / NRRL Y-366-8) TaxID=683960 RepID=A0A1E3P1N7_WICAA|nr:uncharacterized protein WICANDRAFT_79771 [Wickerhamomyces anomalus NRRL Y-366-8]ODQ59253.1 hypothetical protein WICANDRAFT_79771 [Wickerhamomyces anomalus NRRL Y-366-8]
MSVDFSITNNAIDFSRLMNDEINSYNQQAQSLLKNDINSTCDYLNEKLDDLIQTFNTTLQMRLNQSIGITTNQINIQSLLNSLNSSIIDSLSQDKANIDNLKATLDKAVYVGDSVDTSNLSLNYDSIQQSLQAAINDQPSVYDNTSIVELNNSSGDIFKQLDEIFQNALDEIQNFNTTIETNQTFYNLQITPNLLSTNITNNNSTTNSSLPPIQSNEFAKQSKINLITIGIFLIISYIFIMIYQYFRFRYQTNYTASRLIDLEKSDSKMDYIGVIQSTNEPTVTMITDIQTRLMTKSKPSEKLFWTNSYLFGDSANLPYLFMMIFILLILMLSLGKIKWGVTNDSGSTDIAYSIIKQYNLTQFNQFKDFGFNDSIIDDYNSNIYDKFQNITSTLQDLFKTHNITAILSLSPPNITHQNITLKPFKSSLETSSLLTNLNNLNFEINTKINTSSIQTPTIISTVLTTISTTFTHIIQIALISTSIAFFLIIFIGILYSFLV